MNAFDTRLQNELFPEKPAAFDRMLQRTLSDVDRRAQQKPTFAWAKRMLPVAACLVLLCGTLLLIPSARAEVFRWLGAGSSDYAADYLAASENERAVDPDLDPLIAKPTQGEAAVPLPVDNPDGSARASEIAAFLHENGDVALGEALYDGEALYQSIRLNGLSGLYLLEAAVGGNETALVLEPESAAASDGTVRRPDGYLTYELPDGSRHRGLLQLSGAVTSYTNALRADGAIDRPETLDARNRSYLLQHGLVAVAEIAPLVEDWEGLWERQADADGNLRVKVFYDVCLSEAPDVPAATLYSAELGTITVDLHAYQALEQSSAEGVKQASVTFGAETAVISHVEEDYHGSFSEESGVDLTFTKYRVSLEDVTLHLEAKEAVVSALGVRHLRLRITVPKSWTWNERKALLDSLEVKVLINGASGDWGAQFSPTVSSSGALILDELEVTGIPHEMLSSIETISFYLCIGGTEQWSLDGADSVAALDPDAFGESVTVHMPTLNFSMSGHADPIAFPQYAVTLRVH